MVFIWGGAFIRKLKVATVRSLRCVTIFSVSVDETSRNITLTVERSRGTFGEVAVFFYAQSIVEGTDLGFDYKVSPQVRQLLVSLYTKIILHSFEKNDLG